MKKVWKEVDTNMRKDKQGDRYQDNRGEETREEADAKTK
jgi:hypothetical protein